MQGSDGNFMARLESGGPTGSDGTVFKISTNGALTNLYSFTGGDGAQPWAGLVQGSDGNFYGTTSSGRHERQRHRVQNQRQWGVDDHFVFASPAWQAMDGAEPQAALVQGSDGNFYGTTFGGGTNDPQIGGDGTVFKISTNGALTTLYSFTGLYDGARPNGLVQGSDGNFYGTTGLGVYGDGTVFKISANGALTTLHYFAGSPNPASLTARQRWQFLRHDLLGWHGPTGHRVQNHHQWGATPVCIPSPAAMMAEVQRPRWCRAATAISMARLPAAARSRGLPIMAPCSKSAPMGR